VSPPGLVLGTHLSIVRDSDGSMADFGTVKMIYSNNTHKQVADLAVVLCYGAPSTYTCYVMLCNGYVMVPLLHTHQVADLTWLTLTDDWDLVLLLYIILTVPKSAIEPSESLTIER
jgi:hypothetical protein